MSSGQLNARRSEYLIDVQEQAALNPVEQIYIRRQDVNHAEPRDPFWKPLNFATGAAAAPPAAMIAGWHDIFLPWQLKDYAAMQAARRPASLTIGPWMHSAVEAWGEGVRQALSLFRTHLLGHPAQPRAPVRLYVAGAEEWRDYDSWPPSDCTAVAFYLSVGGRLSTKPPIPSEPSCYTYDPADPTPAVYGPRLSTVRATGDMARLENRSDVLLFTSEPLAASIEVIGPVVPTSNTLISFWSFVMSLRTGDVRMSVTATSAFAPTVLPR